MKVKISKGERIFRICNYILLTLISLICIYPFWHALMASFSDGLSLRNHIGFLWKPAGYSLEAYEKVFQNKNIWTGFRNTFFLLIVGVPLDLLLTSIAAYFLSRKSVMWQKPILMLFMLTMYFSGGTIPYYLNLKDMGMTGTLWGLIIPSAISTWNVLILKTSFESVPVSLCEAARIDGANHIEILWKVVLPLSKASLAVIALYYGLGIWNSWFWASVILRENKLWPLQLVLREMIIMAPAAATGPEEMLTLESVKYSTMIVSIVPILFVYPFVQKHFTKGVLVGAVKG